VGQSPKPAGIKFPERFNWLVAIDMPPAE